MKERIEPGIVFQRTERGDALMRAGAAALGNVARRLLPLIDGNRRIGDLPDNVRPGDLEAAITELQTNGLIRSTNQAEPPNERALQAQTQAEMAMLAMLQTELNGLFKREMGKPGEIWDARVADSVNLNVLRRVLREGIDVAYFRSGADVARNLIDAVRPIFKAKKH